MTGTGLDAGTLTGLRGWLEDRRGEMVGLTARLARIESPSDTPAAVAEVQDAVGHELEAMGFRVRRLASRDTAGHLLAVPMARVGRGPVQLLVGHLDTVWPVGTLTSMPVREEEGRLHGPGVFDMKGGVVQGLYAVRALQAAGVDLPATPVFFLNGDEEIGSPDSMRHVTRLARAACRALILEPAFGEEGALKTARKGVGGFTLRFHGVPAHAGLEPERGRSAIVAMARTVERLHELTDLERGLTVNPGVVSGGTRPNVVAAEARLEVDVRARTAQDAAEAGERIHALPSGLEGVTLEITGGVRTPPLEPTPRNRRLWEAARAVAGNLGLTVEERAVGGGSDGNHTSLHTATLDGLGPVGDGAHASHEHLRMDRMPERAALLAGLLAHPVDDVR